MHPRKRLDISWPRLATAGARCAMSGAPARAALEAWWSPDGHALAALSVRTLFDLWLRTLDARPGDELAISAVTIPHMAALIRAHGLTLIPIPIDPDTLGPACEAVEAALTPRTRGVVIAHLLGARLDLDAIAALCAARGVPLVEDCAQAWAADGWRGHPGAQLSLFSFGLIKSCTAVGGAMATVRDAACLAAMRAREAAYPTQTTADYATRLARAAALQVVLEPRRYAGFVRACAVAGRDHDALLRAWSKGFAGDGWVERLRRRPCEALLATLLDALRDPNAAARIRARREAGELVRAALPSRVRMLGRAAPDRTHWLVCLASEAPEALIGALRAAGFDATDGASTLVSLDERAGSAIGEAMARIVYVPVDASMGCDELARLARLLEGGL
jgi:perosamine synthetase